MDRPDEKARPFHLTGGCDTLGDDGQDLAKGTTHPINPVSLGKNVAVPVME